LECAVKETAFGSVWSVTVVCDQFFGQVAKHEVEPETARVTEPDVEAGLVYCTDGLDCQLWRGLREAIFTVTDFNKGESGSQESLDEVVDDWCSGYLGGVDGLKHSV
jgi:hypothetical protein